MGAVLILLLRFLPYILALVAATSALGYATYRLEHWCNSVCRAQTTKLEHAEALLKAAKERATALALLWAAEVDKTEVKNREAERERAAKFEALASRARSLPSVPSVRLSVDADRVWRDASREANAARPAAEREAPAPAVSQPAYSEADLAAFFVASAAAYADAYGQWAACVNHYEALRSQ